MSAADETGGPAQAEPQPRDEWTERHWYISHRLASIEAIELVYGVDALPDIAREKRVLLGLDALLNEHESYALIRQQRRRWWLSRRAAL
jgi:hypothetical protein